MKTLLLFLTTIIFTSCELYDVKLANGAVIETISNSWEKGYDSGDTVCIKKDLKGNWLIDNDGNMIEDTVYGEWFIGVIE